MQMPGMCATSRASESHFAPAVSAQWKWPLGQQVGQRSAWGMGGMNGSRWVRTGWSTRPSADPLSPLSTTLNP
eukprot:32549-Chlamydomonas_euryale.AAC.2